VVLAPSLARYRLTLRRRRPELLSFRRWTKEFRRMSAVQSRLDETLSRADEILRQRLKQEIAEQERADAARADEARLRARRNAERCREHQERFSDAFEAFGLRAPAPVDGERSVEYRDRLWNSIVRKLPPTHDMASIYADDLSTQVMNGLEPELLQAAKAEGERPSFDNLPSDGSLIARQRVDEDTGAKATHWFGKESFIKSLGREGRRVARIVHPVHGALWGAPFSRAG
jgi:hypothetical protein